MSATPTVLTSVKIDINPNGISLIFEGLDANLASLLQAAGTFTAQVAVPHSFDTADITIQSDKAISFVAPPTT